MERKETRPFASARELLLRSREAGLEAIRSERSDLEARGEELSSAARFEFAAAMVDADLFESAFADAFHVLERARAENDENFECRAQLLIAVCYWRQKEMEPAYEAIVAARKAMPSGDLLLESKIAETEGLVLKARGELIDSASCFVRAREVLDPDSHTLELARISINLISVLINLGDVKSALNEGLLVRESLIGEMDLRVQYSLAYNMTVANMRLLEFEAAWEESQLATELQQRSGVQLEVAGLQAIRIKILVQLGRSAEARGLASKLIDLPDEDFGPRMRLRHLAFVGECLHKLGQHEDADRSYIRALGSVGVKPYSPHAMEARLGQLALWTDMNRFEEVIQGLNALEETESLEFRDDHRDDLTSKARIWELRARCAADGGDQSAAYEHMVKNSQALKQISTMRSKEAVGGLQVLHGAFRERSLRDTLKRTNKELAEKVRAQTQSLERAQRFEALGRLAGGVAHDFNNLLTVIGGGLELLNGDLGDNAPGRALVSEGLAAVRRGANLTDRLLAFGRRIDLALKSKPVSELLENSRFLLERLVGEQVQLVQRTNMGPGTPERWVLVDESQLDAVMMNLALNARDAMPDGGRLAFTTRLLEDELQIDIEDTGTGIDESVIGSLFEPFSTTKGAGYGTGLGLASSLGIVKGMGGNLELMSTGSDGTVFRVTLPLTRPPKEPEAKPEESPEIVLHGLDCLVIEDDDAVRSVMCAFLRHLGLNVTEAVDGQDAFEKLNGELGPALTPDLLVCDVSMPRCTGPELLVRMREHGFQQPLLFVSGWHGRYLRELHSENDSVAFLEKPIEIAEIAVSLGNLIERNRSGTPPEG